MIQVYACHYRYDPRVLAVMVNSIKENSPSSELVLAQRCFEYGPDKFRAEARAWADAIENADTPLVLLDCDVIVLRDLGEIFKGADWDIAHCPMPGPGVGADVRYNTGIVAINPTEKANEFGRVWLERSLYWGETKERVKQAKRKYFGTDQAGFADAIEIVSGLRVGELDYHEWNLCEDWAAYTEGFTGMVHLKGHWHKVATRGVFPCKEVRGLWDKYCTGPEYDICVVCFQKSHPDWERMVKACEQSVKDHASKCASFEVIRPPMPTSEVHPLSIRANHVKLLHWRERVMRAKRPLLLLDADTLVLGDLSHVFTLDFDVGITFHESSSSHPNHFNGGAVFVQPGEGAQALFDSWVAKDDELFDDPAKWKDAQNKHRGMNQSSLFLLMHSGQLPVESRILEMPCSSHNCVEQYWRNMDGGALILHIKPRLRRCVFRRRSSAHLKHSRHLGRLGPHNRAILVRRNRIRERRIRREKAPVKRVSGSLAAPMRICERYFNE